MTRPFVNPTYAERSVHAVAAAHVANLKRFGYIAHEVIILDTDGGKKDNYMVVTKSDGTTNTVRLSTERVPNSCTCEHFTREVEANSPHATKLWACKHIFLVAMIWHPTEAAGFRPTVNQIAGIYADKKVARDLFEAKRRQPVVNGRGRDPWLDDAALDEIEGHLATAPQNGPITSEEPWVPVGPQKPTNRRPCAVVCEEM